MAALGFAWLGLLVSLLAYERSSYRWALGAGALFGLGVLTKLAIAPIPAGLMMILIGASLSSRFRDRRGLWVAVWATVATLVVVFLLWPAMWKAPIETLRYVATTSEQVAEAGHASTFGGRRTKDPGVAFYVQVLLSATPLRAGFGGSSGLGDPLVPEGSA
jgi:4-amino-4-deoxy-L-arabinose transferase-like glycosyltransferase